MHTKNDSTLRSNSKAARNEEVLAYEFPKIDCSAEVSTDKRIAFLDLAASDGSRNPSNLSDTTSFREEGSNSINIES